MYVFQVPASFSFEILSFSLSFCQQQIILISHDNKNCFDIFFVAKTRSFRFHYDAFTMEFIFFPESPDKIFCTESRFPADIYTGFLLFWRKWVTHPILFVVARGEKCCFDAAFFCVFPRLRRSRNKKMLAKRNVKNILKLLLRHIVNSINKEEVE